jgi:competence protein ComEA
MFKKVLAFFAAMSLAAAFAAVDVNKASEAELDGIKHIGPATSRLIISERKKSEFKNWDDFIARVKGVGEKRAADFSASGLTVGGAAYTGKGAADAKAKAKTKAEVKADAKADKKADKPVTEKAKDAEVATKDAVKGAAVATKDAVKETAKDAKAAVTSKKETKAEVKVEATKPAASAAKK